MEQNLEDLVVNPVANLTRVLEFLGLTYDERVFEFSERAKKKSVRSPTYHAVAQPIYKTSIGRWCHYESAFGPAMKILQPYVDEFGY